MTMKSIEMHRVSSYFVHDKRSNGEEFCTIRDDSPKWLLEAIHLCHGDTLPRDWIYEECFNAVCAIEDGRLTQEEGAHEFADSEVDIYTRNLYQWATDFCLTSIYSDAEEQAREMGAFDTPECVHYIIGAIQYCAIAQIADTMLCEYYKNTATEAVCADAD